MKYIEFVNGLIRREILEHDDIVLYGQNISAGSCLSGLTKNLEVRENSLIINTPNSENALCGIGFGLMLNKVSSIFFMKQQDFLLLGADQIVNTYNFIRKDKPEASYTIFPIIVDSGYEGPQSRLNNFGDFCSLAGIEGYTITNKVDAEEIIGAHLISPGFRIISVSQRLFKTELLEVEKVYSNEAKTLFCYKDGKDICIVCFNLSFPNGWQLANKFKDYGLSASIFSVNSQTPISWDEIIQTVNSTKNIIIIDDSKSDNIPAYSLLKEIHEKCELKSHILIKRKAEQKQLRPSDDRLDIDYDGIVKLFI